MLKGREILSLPVITMDRQKPIGEVKDIVYDPMEGHILGYVLEDRGWLKDGRGFLHSDTVIRENDCLMIKDESVVRPLSEIPGLPEAVPKDLRGLPVEEEGGRALGVIQDVVVETENGRIVGYELSDGVVQDLLEGRSTISADMVSIDTGKVIVRAGMDTNAMKGE